MKAQEILREIEKIYYWDARVLGFDCRYFGDEVLIKIEDEEESYRHYEIEFLGCIKVEVSTALDDRTMPIKELTRGQRPYFMQDISIDSYELEGQEIFICHLLLPPVAAEIHFTKIRIGTEYH